MSDINVHITGTGIMSSLGNSVSEFFDALLTDKCGVCSLPEWKKYKGLRSYLGAPVGSYDVQGLPRIVRRSMSRMSEMTALAADQALKQACLTPGPQLNSNRTLIVAGSTTGSPEMMDLYFRQTIERGGPEGQLSTTFLKFMSHTTAANLAASLNFQGAVLSPSAACATSAQAIIIGWELIKANLYDVVIAGGADELHYMSTATFDIVGAASRKYNEEPLKASRPFDKNRDGLVVSEGAGIVVMESEASLKRRGVKSLGQIKGGAYLCNGTHMTQSNSTVMSEVINLALDRSSVSKTEIGYVNAHATGTVQGDLEEARAIGSVFGSQVPVSSLKGHMGHSLAACGAIEVIASIEMMKQECLIPTLNLEDIDPLIGEINLIQSKERTKVKSILSNNFAFGGINTSIVLSI